MDYVAPWAEANTPRTWGRYDELALSWIYGNEKAREAAMKENPLYCTDEHRLRSPLCRAFDLGITPAQIVLNDIEQYDWLYELRNKRAYRKFWDTTGYVGGVYASVYDIQRMWHLALFDWGGGGVQEVLKRLDQVEDPANVKTDQEYDEMSVDFYNDISSAIGMTMAFYDSILNEPASERNYQTEYDPFYGDVIRLGIIIDKLFATFAFMDLQDISYYDPNVATYSSMYDAAFGTQNDALAQRVLDDMLGANYDTFPWFKYYALNIFAAVTNTNLIGNIQYRDRIAIQRYNRADDLEAEYGEGTVAEVDPGGQRGADLPAQRRGVHLLVPARPLVAPRRQQVQGARRLPVRQGVQRGDALRRLGGHRQLRAEDPPGVLRVLQQLRRVLSHARLRQIRPHCAGARTPGPARLGTGVGGCRHGCRPASAPAPGVSETVEAGPKKQWSVNASAQYRQLAVTDPDPLNDRVVLWSLGGNVGVFEGGKVFVRFGLSERFVAEQTESGVKLRDTSIGLNYGHAIKFTENHELSLSHRLAFFLPTSRASLSQDLYVAPQYVLITSYELVHGLTLSFSPDARYRWHRVCRAAGIDGVMNVQWELGLHGGLDWTFLETERFGSLGVGASAGSGWQRKYASRDDHESTTSPMSAIWYQSYDWEAHVWVTTPLQYLSLSLAVEHGGNVLRDGIVNTFFTHRDETELARSPLVGNVLSTGRGAPPSAPGSFRRRGGTRPGSGVRTHLRETPRGGAERRGRRARPKPGRRRRRRCLGAHRGGSVRVPGQERLALGPRQRPRPAPSGRP
jgi:hypothetical protein